MYPRNISPGRIKSSLIVKNNPWWTWKKPCKNSSGSVEKVNLFSSIFCPQSGQNFPSAKVPQFIHFSFLLAIFFLTLKSASNLFDAKLNINGEICSNYWLVLGTMNSLKSCDSIKFAVNYSISKLYAKKLLICWQIAY